ncbi:hypothetical protein LSAT2_006247 [Lamellibrachia satsuma]|nr:hypothetical protein LSAT2_006247 [Lamellibrachia satsuma]
MRQEDMKKYVTIFALLATCACVAGYTTLHNECLMLCDRLFMACLQHHCSRLEWPLPVNHECAEERAECIQECIIHYKDDGS